MQAIVQDVYGDADVLQLRDIPTPSIGANDVLIRVRAAGVDRGVWHLMTGTPHLVRLFIGRRGPRTKTRGRDVAGTIEAVGSDVTRFKVGDDVLGTSDGSFAEYVSVNEKRLVLKPSNVSFAAAAAMPTSGSAALLAVRDLGHVGAQDNVLILGASGGVGVFAVQLAVAAGAAVTGVSSASKRDLVLSLGAHTALDYATDPIGRGASGTGYNVIIDVGGGIPLAELRRALTPKGRLVLVGAETGGAFLGGLARQLRASAISPWVKQKLLALVSSEKPETLEHLAALLESGELVAPIEREFALAEAPDAMQHLADGRVRGKVVVTLP